MYKPRNKSIGTILLTLVMVVSLILPAGGSAAFAQTNFSDLIISEYIEGGSNNKAIELFNGTGSTINLSGYSVELYANGSSSVTASVSLSGSVAHGDVFVIANSSANAAIKAQADVYSGVANFNGDDAIVLKSGSTVLDVFGRVGQDPGSYWGSGSDVTKDRTLVRKSTISSGETDRFNAFNPADEWDVYSKDTTTYLGAHVADVAQGNDTIATVRSASVGTAVTTEGIVTSVDGQFFIQDQTAGINVYPIPSGVSIGDKVEVSGNRAERYGLAQIENAQVQVVSSGNSVPAAQVVTASQIGEGYEGERVTIQNATLAAGNYGNYTATDSTGTVLVDPKASGSDTWLTAGAYDQITGIVMYEYSQYEIMPVSTADIVADNGGGSGDSGGSTDPGNYYDSAAGLTGLALKAALNDLIDNHTTLSYSQAYNALIVTDADPNNANNVLLLYSGRSENGPLKYDNGQGWNREHVWAKSHGDFGTAAGPGTDLHMLRATDVDVNSARSSYDFDELNGGGVLVDETTDCYVDVNGKIFEPRDEVKGDVARMLFYMAVRYEEGDEIDLELSNSKTSVNNTSSGYGEHGVLTTLLQWHAADPVTDYERNRNEIVYTQYQGNRNPFIDHPEYVEAIWGTN